MSVPPPSNDPYPFDFDSVPSQPPSSIEANSTRSHGASHYDADVSIVEGIADEIDDALGISDKLIGCSWWLLTLPFRLIWNLIEGIFD